MFLRYNISKLLLQSAIRLENAVHALLISGVQNSHTLGYQVL